MKIYIKNGMKVLADYTMSLMVFLIFLYPFIGLTKGNLYRWLPLYSAIFFIIAYLAIYSDMRELAKKEKKPQYQLNPYPFKGAVYGLIGIIPVSVLVLAGSLMHFSNFTADRMRHLFVNALLGPLYFLFGTLKESIAGYIIALLTLPLIAMLGYLAGFYGINIIGKVFRKKEAEQERTFTKSPWNPTNNAKKSSGKKKKKNV
ncbi:MAG TPA: hypothetical protein VHT96_09925 [Clostridia bacterium]|nr:hypothetical protein [Clostridia bacterium]